MNARDEKRIAGLEMRVRELENHILRLEATLRSGATPPSVSVVSDENPVSPMTAIVDAAEEHALPPSTSSADRPSRGDWEMHFGKVWMPRIFVVVLLIGVVWGFLAAVKAGWINQPVRVVLGYLVFIGLTVYGEFQMVRKRDALGQVLLGGATALGVLTTFAASTLYGLIGPTPAFVLDVVFALGGVYFSVRHRSEALAVVSMVASLLVPFLVKSSHPNLTVFILYESVASFGFTIYSLNRKYVYLAILSLLSLHVTFGTLSIIKLLRSEDFVIPVLLQVIGLFGLVLYAHDGLKRRHRLALITAVWVSLGFATLWVYGELPNHLAHTYLWVATGLLLVVTVAAWKRQGTPLLLSAIPFWIYLSLASFAVMSNQSFYWVFVLITAAAVLTAVKSKCRAVKVEANILFAISGLLLVAAYSPFWGHTAPTLEHVTWILYALCTFVLVYGFVVKDQPRMRITSTWFGIVVLGLFLTHESQVLTFHLSQDTQHMVLSLVWILYAIAAIGYGVLYGDTSYRRFGTIFLFVTLSQLVLVDIPAVSLFVRAILFIAIGGLGVLTSRVFYRKKE